jgi:penicillin-binding protein 1A
MHELGLRLISAAARPCDLWYMLHPYLRWALIGLAASCVTAAIAAAAYIAHVMPAVPSDKDLLELRVAEPSTLLSADGKPLATYRLAKQKRVRLDEVSPHAIKALIATEDRRFYKHHGIDPLRTVMAVLQTLQGSVQGGSTITQQLARNLFPDEIGRERTINRKVKEMITAVRIERLYSKQQILETYLNSVPFLYNVIGIEMAARTYYDKSASELDALESATLIGMLKGSRAYNPVVNPERSRARRNVVLASMVADGKMSEAEQLALRDKPLQVRFNPQPIPPGPAPHFAEHVRKWLIEWADARDYDIYTDGLTVHTTIDSSLQEAATQAVTRQADILQTIAEVEWGRKSPGVASHSPEAYAKLRGKVVPFEHFWKTHDEFLDTSIRETPEYAAARQGGEKDAAVLAKLRADAAFVTRIRNTKTRLEASFLAMDPASGEIRAWIGSRNFEADQFDHAAQAERQPGSTFKPFVYAAALERGISPDHTYVDEPVAFTLPDGKVWKPTDMSGSSGAPMTLREGLVRSKNTITVQVMRDVGIPGIVSLARAMGIDRSTLDPVPSLALGTSPVTLLEMVSAYSTIAGAGQYRKPVFITRIVDRHGKVLASFGPETGRLAMSERSAVELLDMMRGVVTQGTGQAIKTRFGIVADLGGKTGTTQKNTDGWFILMHPGLVAGAWVGFNDTRVTMRSNYWGQGGHNAIFIVGDFFREALARGSLSAKAQFPRPPARLPVVVAAELKAGEEIQPAKPPAGNEPVISITRRAPVSAEELTRIMASMGRDPDTGVQSGTARAPEPVAPRAFTEPVAPRATPEPVAPLASPEPVAPLASPEPVAPRSFFPRTFPPPGAEPAEAASSDSQR